MSGPPPNNPLKAPTFVVCGVFAVVLIAMGVYSAGHGGWVLIIVGVPLLVLNIASFRVVRAGRNPIWMRAPLDYLFDRRRS